MKYYEQIGRCLALNFFNYLMGSICSTQCIKETKQNQLLPYAELLKEQFQGYSQYPTYNFSAIKNIQFSRPISTQGLVGDIVLCEDAEQLAAIQVPPTQAKREEFLDPDFPPNQFSLTGKLEEANQGIIWKRAKAFMEFPINVFDNRLSPCDIIPGELGNHYFLSALSILAEQPTLIKRLFQTTIYQRNGQYILWLCTKGLFKAVTLDDNFPCQEGKTFCSRTSGNELWVLLLEKAYAKMYGSYCNVASGTTCLALRDLTGAPYEVIALQDNEKPGFFRDCWDVICQSLQNSLLLAAKSEIEESLQDLGLFANHSYAILAAKQVIDSHGEMDRIIKMRNPWSKFEWNGRWSENSLLWTEELRAELAYKSGGEGIFWVSFSDFLKYFTELTVFKVHQNYKYLGHHIKFPAMTNEITRTLVAFEVFKSGHYYLGVSQMNLKLQRNERKHSYITVLIGKLEEDMQLKRFVAQAGGSQLDVFVEAELEQGLYILLVDVHWQPEAQKLLNISSYGEEGLSFKELEASEMARMNVLFEMIRLHSTQKECTSLTVKYLSEDRGVLKKEGCIGSYNYILIENATPTSVYYEVDFKNPEELIFLHPSSVKFPVRLNVREGESGIIIVKRRGLEVGTNKEFKYKIVEELSEVQIMKRCLEQENPKLITAVGTEGDVKVFSLRLPYGFALYFVNETQQKFISKQRFKLKNLVISGQEENGLVEFNLEPQGRKLIFLRAKDPLADFQYSQEAENWFL